MLLKDNLLIEQPELTRAIKVIAAEIPELQKQIRATLEILLAEIRSSPQPETAWEGGTLNKNGFPVEFTFASQDASIRYTTEVAGAEVSPSERLSHTQQQLANLEATQLPETVITRLHQIQITDSLKWGAWIGVRHRSEGDRYKLYVEVPEQFHLLLKQC